MADTPDFLPAAELQTLQRRSRLLQHVRQQFVLRNYWEVETPILSRDCCIDQWLDPFEVELGNGDRAYLQTSPEFAMKRLICAGADRIFEIARVFRQDETGGRHNPEFTMIEWYERGSDHHAQMDFIESLVVSLRSLAEEAGWVSASETKSIKFSRLSYEQAFQNFAGVSPANDSLSQLYTAAKSVSGWLSPGLENDRDGLLNLLIAEVVEPELKKLQAVFLYDFPASQAALAKTQPGPPPIAERFELYLDGMEICNGYHELTDAGVLRTRMREQNQKRMEQGKRSMPVESRLLQAMDIGLPECSGVALGFDRLAMWCLGLSTIREVIAFPFDRA